MWPVVAVIFFFSVVVHEVAHGVIAERCGDDTARAAGRITLNPLVHIDIFGTIIVPVMMYLLGGVVIGWAKPVPVNPNNFRDIRMDTMKVGVSGPLTNFTLAVIFALLVWLLNLAGVPGGSGGFLFTSVCAAGVAVNIVLGLFNLVPIPPMDGSRIVSALLPEDLSRRYDRLAPYGFFILILMLSVIWGLIIRFGNIFYRMLFTGLPI
ncbi:MAG: site-2 protease family protein [Elusimicrobia bacterium]|nr:site-2 protease family protein [Elusimicrobiota bacterium]